MADENQENTSLSVERLSIQPEKPSELVKSMECLNFYC